MALNFNQMNNPSSLIQSGIQKQVKPSVGNRIYNGFSSSPHVGGGLNKTGYQKRDQEQANKKLLIRRQQEGFK